MSNDDVHFAQQPDSSLLMLPGEVRNHILEIYFTSFSTLLGQVHKDPTTSNPESPSCRLGASILFSCKQLRHESLPFFLRGAMFNIIGFSNDEVGFPDPPLSFQRLQNTLGVFGGLRSFLGGDGTTMEIAWGAFDPTLSLYRNQKFIEHVSDTESRVGLFRRPTFYEELINKIVGRYYLQPVVNTDSIYCVKLRDDPVTASSDHVNSETSFKNFYDEIDPYRRRLADKMIERGAKFLHPPLGCIKAISIENDPVEGQPLPLSSRFLFKFVSEESQ